MDDFLLIVGSGWIEVPSPSVVFLGFADMATLLDLSTNEDWNALSVIMESVELIPNGAIISAARVINTGTTAESYRFWYQM